jgi:transposase
MGPGDVALPPQTMLLADRGYDADWIRELARQQAAWANIPPKRNRKDPICFSPYLYRARNLARYRELNNNVDIPKSLSQDDATTDEVVETEPLLHLTA